MYAKYLMTGQTPDFNLNKSDLAEINLSDITDTISDKVESVKEKAIPESNKSEISLYKWRDEKGVIHYTSEKPTSEVKKLETIKIDNQTNVMPAVSDAERGESPSSVQTTQQSTPLIPENLYSPEGVKQLIDQAKDVQNLVNEHYDQQQEIINNN